MTFLPFRNNFFDLLYARHTLEHSPIPLLTLFEWHRITKKMGYCLIIVPFDNITRSTHFSVFRDWVWQRLFKYSGWELIKKKIYGYKNNKKRLITSSVKKCFNNLPMYKVEFHYLLKKL